MKIETLIKPRLDGSVTAEFGSVIYRFVADALGRLVAEVANNEHVGQLLSTGHFHPADEADFEAGILAANAISAAVHATSEEDEGEYSNDDDDDSASMDTPPVESNTPPTRVSRKAK